MTHQPYLPPRGGHRGQFVLGDTRFGSVAVADRDDQTNPHRVGVESGELTVRPAAGPIVGTVMMQTTVTPNIGYQQDQ